MSVLWLLIISLLLKLNYFYVTDDRFFFLEKWSQNMVHNFYCSKSGVHFPSSIDIQNHSHSLNKERRWADGDILQNSDLFLGLNHEVLQ